MDLSDLHSFATMLNELVLKLSGQHSKRPLGFVVLNKLVLKQREQVGHADAVLLPC